MYGTIDYIHLILLIWASSFVHSLAVMVTQPTSSFAVPRSLAAASGVGCTVTTSQPIELAVAQALHSALGCQDHDDHERVGGAECNGAGEGDETHGGGTVASKLAVVCTRRPFG